MVVALQQPHTEQQYRQWGSTILVYNVFTEAIGKMFFAHFRKPMVLETLEVIILISSYKSKLLST